jgi:hypothetical protein
MALEEPVRGTSISCITELENISCPPTEIFDIGSVKRKITSKARPISPKLIQANGSVKVNVTPEALDEPVLPTPLQHNASPNVNIGSKASSQTPSLTALQHNDAFAIKTRKSIVGSIFESSPPSEVRQLWEKLIGTSCRPLGKSKLQCWEAEGPALELTCKLVSDVRKHLDCKTNYIYGRKAVRPPLILGIYMVGKSSADARPFLVVSCGQDEPRERAMKLIKKSKILDQFEEKGGVRLREQRRPPTSTGPVTHVSGGSSQDMSTRNATRVYYDPAHGTLLSSLQLYIQISSGSGTVCWHKATVGCFLWFRGRYLAFTAAHPFLDLPSSPDSDEESELDFPFEDDSETSATYSDEDDFEEPPNGLNLHHI